MVLISNFSFCTYPLLSSAFIYEYFLFAYLNLIHTEILRLPPCRKLDAEFTEFHRNQRLVGCVIQTFKKINIKECVSNCINFPACKSVNFLDYQEESMQATGKCEMNSEDSHSGGKAKVKSREKSTIVQTPQLQPNVSVSDTSKDKV